MADPRGMPGTHAPPLGVQILSFPCSFSKNVAKQEYIPVGSSRLSWGWGGSASVHASVHAGIPAPSRSRPPKDQTTPPGPDHPPPGADPPRTRPPPPRNRYPLGQDSPRTRHPLGDQTPPFGTRHPPVDRHTPVKT